MIECNWFVQNIYIIISIHLHALRGLDEIANTISNYDVSIFY